MATKAIFQQNTEHNAADLRAIFDAAVPTVSTSGAVASGLTTTIVGGNTVTIAPGVGYAKHPDPASGYTFVVANTAVTGALNDATMSATWAPASSSQSRRDLVYAKVEDKALDGATADAVKLYFKTGTAVSGTGAVAPALPTTHAVILLAEVYSYDGGGTAVTDRRRLTLDASPASRAAGCIVTRSASLAVAQDTDVTIPWDGELRDTDSFHSLVSNTSRITIPTGLGGLYDVGANVGWNAAATQGSAAGIRALRIMVNGVQVAANDIPSSANVISHMVSVPLQLAAGDYVEFMLRQNSLPSEGGIYTVSNPPIVNRAWVTMRSTS